MSVVKIQHQCKWCHRTFIRETAYMDHECKQMKREKELKSPDGQAAWQYYHNWMRQKKRVAPNAAAFMDSKLFRTFINFAQFVKKVQLPLPDKFIWLMIKKDYPPTMWMRDDVYALYLEFIDNKMPPIDQAKQSIKTLFDFADAYDVDLENIFEVINPNELIHLIRIRKLSPWLLLFSQKFREFFAGMSEEQQVIVETFIKPEVWAEKRVEHKADIEIIKGYIGELGI